MKHIKPIVVVSKCLGFEACRYNGDIIPDRFVKILKKHVNFIPVCPECEIGLGVPRDPIRIVKCQDKKILYQPATEKDITKDMLSFTNDFLGSFNEVDGFILKFRSPSCGLKNVKMYVGFENDARHINTSGFFATGVVKRFPGKAIEDEGRLKNFTIREHFLIKLFTLARFRELKKDMKSLIEFHSDNKYLMLAYDQVQLKKMGHVLGNQEKKGINIVVQEYQKNLEQALSKEPRFTSTINSLMKMYYGFSENLTDDEKKFFMDSIQEFRDERIPLSTLIHLINSWAIRFNIEYLKNQTLVNPYPIELVQITDSGKGRDL